MLARYQASWLVESASLLASHVVPLLLQAPVVLPVRPAEDAVDCGVGLQRGGLPWLCKLRGSESD